MKKNVNTLGKKVTSQFFLMEGGFKILERRWSLALIQGKELSAAHNLMYAVLRGKDWRKGFAEPSEKHLSHMRTHGNMTGLELALTHCGENSVKAAVKAIFGEDLINPVALSKAIKALLNKDRSSAYMIEVPYEVAA